MSTHRCPARGCEKRVADRLLMCSVHWARVSGPTQRAVYDHYTPGQRVGNGSITAEYRRAMVQAIEEANASGGAP